MKINWILSSVNWKSYVVWYHIVEKVNNLAFGLSPPRLNPSIVLYIFRIALSNHMPSTFSFLNFKKGNFCPYYQIYWLSTFPAIRYSERSWLIHFMRFSYVWRLWMWSSSILIVTLYFEMWHHNYFEMFPSKD